MARLTEEVRIGELRVTARELTLQEIDAWLAENDLLRARREAARIRVGDGQEWPADVPQLDIVGMSILPGVALDDVLHTSDLEADAARRMTPSELRRVAAACVRVNRDFFGMRARWLGEAPPEIEPPPSADPSAA